MKSMLRTGRLTALVSLAVFLLGLGSAPTAVLAQGAPQLNIMMEGVPDTKFVQELVPEFERKTGLKVNIEVLAYRVMREKLLPQLTARQGAYDVVVVDKQWVGEFVAADWLEPLDPFLAKTPELSTGVYIPAMFNMIGRVGTTTYMLPFYNYTLGLIYRADLYNDPKLKADYKARFGKELAVPSSVEDYVQVAKFMTRKPDFYGVSMQLARGVAIHAEWSNLFFGLGGYYYDASWKATVTSEAGLKALEYIVDLAKNAAPPGATGYNFDEQFAFMAEGKAAHMVTYNWMMPRFNDPKQSKIVGKVDLTLAPGGHGNQGGWGWGIPRSAPNKDAAWKFLAWVESFDVAKRRALAGGSPTRSDVFGDPDVLAKYPHYPTVLKLIATAKAVPLYTGTNQMYVVLAREFSQVLAGQKDPKTALGTVNKELDELAKDDPFVKQALKR